MINKNIHFLKLLVNFLYQIHIFSNQHKLIQKYQAVKMREKFKIWCVGQILG